FYRRESTNVALNTLSFRPATSTSAPRSWPDIRASRSRMRNGPCCAALPPLMSRRTYSSPKFPHSRHDWHRPARLGKQRSLLASIRAFKTHWLVRVSPCGSVLVRGRARTSTDAHGLARTKQLRPDRGVPGRKCLTQRGLIGLRVAAIVHPL